LPVGGWPPFHLDEVDFDVGCPMFGPNGRTWVLGCHSERSEESLYVCSYVLGAASLPFLQGCRFSGFAFRCHPERAQRVAQTGPPSVPVKGSLGDRIPPNDITPPPSPHPPLRCHPERSEGSAFCFSAGSLYVCSSTAGAASLPFSQGCGFFLRSWVRSAGLQTGTLTRCPTRPPCVWSSAVRVCCSIPRPLPSFTFIPTK
jgi:hypothetical protein